MLEPPHIPPLILWWKLPTPGPYFVFFSARRLYSLRVFIRFSNGTSVNGVKLGKRKTSPLKMGDRVALYLPQGASPLGRPILYDLVELCDDKIEQVCLWFCSCLPVTRRTDQFPINC